MYMAMYYNTIIAWAFYYLVVSIYSLGSFELPWARCNNEWSTSSCKDLYQRRNYFNLNDTLSSSSSQNGQEENLFISSPAQEYFE